MFLNLTFLQSIIVICLVWEIVISIIAAIKGKTYNGGASILLLILYGIGKFITYISN